MENGDDGGEGGGVGGDGGGMARQRRRTTGPPPFPRGTTERKSHSKGFQHVKSQRLFPKLRFTSDMILIFQQ